MREGDPPTLLDALFARADLPRPVTPPTHSQLDAAVQHLVAEHTKTDPLLRTLPDMVKAVADHLGVPHEQVEPRRSDVEAVANTMVGIHLANAALAAGPPVYQQLVKSVPWRALAPQMQHNVMQICEAVKSGRIMEAFLVQYLEAVALATEDAPRAPSLSRIGGGALSVLCGTLKVQPPANFSKPEMEEARARLKGLPGQGPFDVCKQLHEQSRADLNWLRKQEVLGAGSVVMYGKMLQVPVILLRPEVNINLGDKQWNRELTYVTTTFTYLKPQLIGDILVRTHWPLRSVPLEFAW